MQDEGFHEFQLNGKQLVFLFMAATVVVRRDLPLWCDGRPWRRSRPQISELASAAANVPTDPTRLRRPRRRSADASNAAPLRAGDPDLYRSSGRAGASGRNAGEAPRGTRPAPELPACRRGTAGSSASRRTVRQRLRRAGRGCAGARRSGHHRPPFQRQGYPAFVTTPGPRTCSACASASHQDVARPSPWRAGSKKKNSSSPGSRADTSACQLSRVLTWGPARQAVVRDSGPTCRAGSPEPAPTPVRHDAVSALIRFLRSTLDQRPATTW